MSWRWARASWRACGLSRSVHARPTTSKATIDTTAQVDRRKNRCDQRSPVVASPVVALPVIAFPVMALPAWRSMIPRLTPPAPHRIIGRAALRSGSSGVLGRSLNSARHQHFVLDSPSGPNEAITNGEAFLAGISSCGVTLIEKHAHDTGVPLRSMEVVIEGIRSNAAPNRFQAIHVTFEMRGVDQVTAQALVETWRDR